MPKYTIADLCSKKGVRLYRAAPSDGHRETHVWRFQWKKTRRCLGLLPAWAVCYFLDTGNPGTCCSVLAVLFCPVEWTISPCSSTLLVWSTSCDQDTQSSEDTRSVCKGPLPSGHHIPAILSGSPMAEVVVGW